ncbi:MAG: PKD domain-containing protein, partial [Candidatus Thorarchaeota archaeon]
MNSPQLLIQYFFKRLTIILIFLSLIGSLIPIVTGQTEGNLPPVSNMYLDPTRHPVINSVKVKEQVYFIGEDSYDPNPEDNLTYIWDFGDGTTSNKISPIHIYSQVGEYLVSLTVNDSYTSSTTSVVILVYTEGGNEPIAFIWVDANRDEKGNSLANVSEAIRFDASKSYDPDGSQLYYDWDFGDGSHSGNRIATHRYKEEGIFTVILKITDEENLVSLDSIS